MDKNYLFGKNLLIFKYLIIISVLSFIFLSGLKYEYFQFRFLIITLFIFSIYRFYLDLKYKKYNSLIVFISITTLFFSHLFFNLKSPNFELNNYILFGYIFFFLIFFISYFFTNEINGNLDSIINLFYYLMIISFLIGLFVFDQIKFTSFCGGIPLKINELFDRTFYLKFDEFIFNENSHLGMIAPGCILYSFYKISKNKTNKLSNVLFLIFFLICILKNSTTLMLGTVLSLILIILFNYKSFSKILLILFGTIILVFSSVLVLSDQCNSRFIPIYIKKVDILSNTQATNSENNKLLEDKRDKLNKSNVSEDLMISIGLPEKYSFLIADFFHRKSDDFYGLGSLSSAVIFHSFSISYKSILDKPFGWGMNGYENAFNYYNKINPSEVSILNKLNKKDGSNNLSKILVEFGIFGIIFYLCLIFASYSKIIPLDYKMIYIPIIITQSLRGAGYFNSGFILIVFLLLFSYINAYKDKK